MNKRHKLEKAIAHLIPLEGEGQSSKIPFGSGDSPSIDSRPRAETDAIKLDSQTETLLEYHKYCRDDTFQCGYLSPGLYCRRYLEYIHTPNPVIPYRCDQCKHEFPNGLKLVGVR